MEFPALSPAGRESATQKQEVLIARTYFYVSPVPHNLARSAVASDGSVLRLSTHPAHRSFCGRLLSVCCCCCCFSGEALEQATLLSSLAADEDAFERHVLQVKAYYADFKWAASCVSFVSSPTLPLRM